MEKKSLQNFDFDPDFSEYNPMLGLLSTKAEKDENDGFITNFIKKFSCRLLIQLD